MNVEKKEGIVLKVEIKLEDLGSITNNGKIRCFKQTPIKIIKDISKGVK
jgi:hypothetical protein